MRRSLAAVTLLLGGMAWAEEGSSRRAYDMEEIVVTPGRTEQELADVPTNVTIVTREDVERSAAQTVDDLLRRVPGFTLFRRSSSLVAHPTTQGVTLRGIAPSGVSRTLVLLDDVPVNDPFGGWVYWSRIPSESIERIEVVRGGGSNPWGNAALGGVIHVLTEDPEPRAARLKAGGGTEDTVELDGEASDVRGPVGVSLGGSFFDTGGYQIVREDQRGPIDEEAFSEHAAFRGRIEYALASSTKLGIRGSYFDERRGNGTRLTRNATDAGSIAGSLDHESGDGSRWRGLAFAQLQTFESTFSAQAPDRTEETPAVDQFDVPSTAVGASLTWSKRVFERHSLGVGGDFRWIDGETNENFFFLEGSFQRRRHAGAEQQLAGLYAQDLIELGPRWHLDVGVRGDVWRSVDPFRQEQTLETGEELRSDRASDRDDLAVSPKIGIVHRPSERLSFRGAFYQGFRAPTINELVRPFRVRNDVTEANFGLDPEQLIGGELGADYARESWLARLTGYWNDVEDPIANVTVATGPGDVPPCGFVPEGGVCRQRRNLGRSRIRGIEAEVTAWPLASWEASAAYLYTDSEIVDTAAEPALDGNRLAQVPEHQVVLRLEYAAADVVDASLQVRYVGEQFEDDQNSLELDDFAVVDLFLGREIHTGVELFFAVENLFDDTYEVGRTADGIVTIGAPLLVHGGIRIRL